MHRSMLEDAKREFSILHYAETPEHLESYKTKHWSACRPADAGDLKRRYSMQF